MKSYHHARVVPNHPSAMQLLRASSSSSCGVRRTDEDRVIALLVRRAKNGAATRLPDGRVVFLGGACTESPAPPSFVPPVLWGPAYVVEHTFDNEADDFREPGPYTWHYISTETETTSLSSVGCTSELRNDRSHSMRSTHSPTPLFCHVVDHTMEATVDLRVFMFGGRSDAVTAASCHNHFYVGRFDRTFSHTTTEAATDRDAAGVAGVALNGPHAPFHRVVPSPVVTSSIAAKAHIPSSTPATTSATIWIDVRHVFDGALPSRRYGHSSTMVGGGRVMLLTGGLNEKGATLRDMNFFVPGIAPLDSGLLHRRGSHGERVVVEGAWLKTSGCPAPLSRLPQPAHHHRVIVLPSPTAPSSSFTFIESWLLVADGKSLFRLDVRVHVPPPVLASEGADEEEPVVPPPSALVWFEPLSPDWVPLLAGGVASSVPFRHSSLVTLLNHDELLVHGGVRCLPSLADQRDAQKKLLNRTRHRAVSAIGDLSDTAFVYNISTLTWSYDAAVTEALGHASSHVAICLDDGRPPLVNAEGFTRHLAVLGSTSAEEPANDEESRSDHADSLGRVSWIPTLSCSGDGLTATLAPEMLQLLASRLCSGVVRRVGVTVGDISLPHCATSSPADHSASTSLSHPPPFELSTTLNTSATTAPSIVLSTSAAALSPARRLSCTSATTVDGPRRRPSAAGARRLSDVAAPGAAWTSPAVMIRDTLLEREDANQQEQLKQLVRTALISVLREALGNDLMHHYYHTWRRAAAGGAVAAASEAASAGSGTSAAQSLAVNARANKELKRAIDATADLRMCAQCRSVPAEVILHPCGHFVLCRLCCNTTSECPECHTEFESTEYGCAGSKFPFLHRFLTEQVDAQQLDKREREEYRRLYLLRSDVRLPAASPTQSMSGGVTLVVHVDGHADRDGYETSRSGRVTPPALRSSVDDQHAQLFSSLMELPSAIQRIEDNEDAQRGSEMDMSEHFMTPARSEAIRGALRSGRPLAEIQDQHRRHRIALFVSGQQSSSPIPRRSLRVPRTLMM
jgi:hypothetical protein